MLSESATERRHLGAECSAFEDIGPAARRRDQKVSHQLPQTSARLISADGGLFEHSLYNGLAFNEFNGCFSAFQTAVCLKI